MRSLHIWLDSVVILLEKDDPTIVNRVTNIFFISCLLYLLLITILLS